MVHQTQALADPALMQRVLDLCRNIDESVSGRDIEPEFFTIGLHTDSRVSFLCNSTDRYFIWKSAKLGRQLMAGGSCANPSCETNQQTRDCIHAGGVPNLHGRFSYSEEAI